MDDKSLRDLLEVISRSNFETFELEREGFRLKLVKGHGVSTVVTTASPPPAVVPAPSPAADPGSPVVVEPPVDETLIEVASPIVGTYYEAPSPDAPPFISVGAQVRKGQVLCIVEAMKLMNEIESEVDAEVVEILAANGQPVEYGEILFRLRPA